MNCSSLAIEMLLHFQTSLNQYRGSTAVTWPPAQQKILGQFLQQGLIKIAAHGYETTPAGSTLARKLRLHFEVLMLDHPVVSEQE